MLQTEVDINGPILSVFTRDYCLSYISIYLLRADNSFFVSEKIELFVVLQSGRSLFNNGLHFKRLRPGIIYFFKPGKIRLKLVNTTSQIFPISDTDSIEYNSITLPLNMAR